jgi:hypothetical protein
LFPPRLIRTVSVQELQRLLVKLTITLQSAVEPDAADTQ